MAIKHTTVKAPGQKVFAVADWNAGHNIENNTITTGHIQDNAITTAKILNANVTTGKTDFADQQLKIASSPTFNDLTISNPVNIYALSHNSFADYAANRHFLESEIDHTNIIAGDGSDHADVVTNTTHSTGDGSDHANVATNTADIATNVTAIGLNTTHRGSDGSDHTFIDQDVTTTGTPTFGITTLGDSSQLATAAAPTADADIANKKYVDDNVLGNHAASHELLGGDLVDHDNLTNFAANEHFTEASIDHTNILNIGVNTHAEIDTHLGLAVTSTNVIGNDEIVMGSGGARGVYSSPNIRGSVGGTLVAVNFQGGNVQSGVGYLGAKLAKIFIDTYTGDNANSRELDLGDDYDEIHIVVGGDVGYTPKLISAWAIQDNYGSGTHFNYGNNQYQSGTNADTIFQGKMSGADVNKIKLGSTGNGNMGTNYLNRVYVIIAKKYADIQTF